MPGFKKFMKIKSSLKSIKKRDLNSKLVRRRGRVYVINKTNPKFKKQDKNNLWIIKAIKIHGIISLNLSYGAQLL